MRVGSFIITYERPAALQQTIETTLNQTSAPDVLLVVDNGTGTAAADVVAAFDDPRLQYEATGSNLGAAGGLMFGMRRLHEAGFDWIHAVDDDNPPVTVDTLERLRDLIGRHPGAELGAVAATGTRWDWSRGAHSRIDDDELVGDLDVDTAGGGQQLIVRRDVITAIGLPDPALFFGFDDVVYCLRMRAAGYRILIDGSLAHQYREIFGRLDLQRTRARVPRDALSSIWRRYYVTRNYICEMRRTFSRPDLARREARKALGRSVTAWRRGPRYGATFNRLQLQAVLDGYRGRMGRTVEPQPKS